MWFKNCLLYTSVSLSGAHTAWAPRQGIMPGRSSSMCAVSYTHLKSAFFSEVFSFFSAVAFFSETFSSFLFLEGSLESLPGTSRTRKSVSPSIKWKMCIRDSYYALRLPDGSVLRVGTEMEGLLDGFRDTLPALGLVLCCMSVLSFLVSRLLTKKLVGQLQDMIWHIDGQGEEVPREMLPFFDSI